MPSTAVPEVLSAREIDVWADTADVIVVGYGIAGACAAIEARVAGADVLVVERASGGGGASALSGGIFYLGGGTPVQEAAGFHDDAENMFRFLMASTGAPDPRLVRRFCANAVPHFHWLEAQGIPFERSYYKDKTVIPPGTHCLSSTGNENAWPYREIAHAVPRGHKVASGDPEAGSVAMRALLGRCAELGVRKRFDSRVTALVRDSAQRIVGVRLSQFGETQDFRARGAVVLAAGGFGFNAEMARHYAPQVPEAAQPLGIPNNDGDGIRLGQSANAATQAMDGVIATASFYPPSQLIKGILVNASGERFVNEDTYHGRMADILMDQPGAAAHLILDSEIFAYPEHEGAKQALVDGWDTVAEMEAGLRLPPGALPNTLDEYNQNAAAGKDPLFHKHPDWLKPLNEPPFAAFDVSYDAVTYVFLTLGGLRTTADAAVLDRDGKVIPGLYAAGACVSSIPQDGRSYASGLSLGPGSYFGRVAGRNAAGESTNEAVET
ncbi:MAG: FAD-dependent oxidoreductase [Gammaproteobacteria bacterium]|nr:FAD-dependent oxidoreductase [Gammaproteobacteria bacterium]